ncbi:hypothetical protein [Arthrobacter sp. V1I9]|nr:hypothetical protein [Arthrobacter sp. V1I9]
MNPISIRQHQESVAVQASAETLYDLVSDITRHRRVESGLHLVLVG